MVSTLVEYPVPTEGVPEFPTLGPQVADFIEANFTFGPGSLQGQPARLSDDQRKILYRAYEYYPKGFRRYGVDMSGRRRFQRVSWSVRKGSAKCLAPGTDLIGASGERIKVEDLHAGDWIVSYLDGKSVLRRVAEVEAQPITAIYRVKTARGREIETSVGHPFLVSGTPWRPGMPKRWKYTSCDPAAGVESWAEVQDLGPGDRLVPGLGWAFEGGDSDLGWLLGVLVGDCTGDGRLSNADSEVAEGVGAAFDLTKLKHRQEGQYYLRGSRDFLRHHGLFGKNAYSKRTPPAVMTGDRETILGYLAGLLDTDGTTILREVSEGKWTRTVEWYSVSQELMSDVQHLLAGVGINATLRPKYTKYKGQPHLSWTVVVADHAQVAELSETLPVVRKRNVENMAAFRDTLIEKGKFADAKLDKVVSVERVEDGITYAVEIEDTHVHVTNGLVTHNTEFMAWVTACELHPDAPVRFAGYVEDITDEQFDLWGDDALDAYREFGLAPGRAVANPYIPLLAYTKDQTEELAYGALRSILEAHDPNQTMFDIGQQRILRKNEYGAEDGKAVPLAGNPNSADGARTTFQGLDETHRLYTPTHRDAIETMLNNLPKRPMEDPWQLAITTAGEPGQGSYAEDEFREGVACAEGKKQSEGFYFLHRQAPDGSKFNTMQQRMEAIWWATSPSVREWTRFDSIAAQWDREGADKQYLERVWTNRWTQTAAQAFDKEEFEALGDPRFTIPAGAFVTVGFDGAKFNDSTGFVVTDIKTGRQNVFGFWERPEESELETDGDGKKVKWQVSEADVNRAFEEIMEKFVVWRLYGDPPHWVETMGQWHSKYPDQVYEFWTKDPTRMYYAVKNYRSAIASGDVSHDGDPDLVAHIGNTGKRVTRGTDEDGQPRFVLTKIAYERKFDLAMCAILSWQARMDAIGEGAEPPGDMEIIRVR